MPPTSVLYYKAIQPECPHRETEAIFPPGGRQGGRRRESSLTMQKSYNKGYFSPPQVALREDE